VSWDFKRCFFHSSYWFVSKPTGIVKNFFVLAAIVTTKFNPNHHCCVKFRQKIAINSQSLCVDKFMVSFFLWIFILYVFLQLSISFLRQITYTDLIFEKKYSLPRFSRILVSLINIIDTGNKLVAVLLKVTTDFSDRDGNLIVFEF
jgi:hypothetical protein